MNYLCVFPQKMKPGREILQELELHAQYKDKYDVADGHVDTEVERILSTQNSIRKHMEERGMDPNQRKIERDERRQQALAAIKRGEKPGQTKPRKQPSTGTGTTVKITNPLQLAAGDFDIEDFDNSDEDSDAEADQRDLD